MNAALKTAEMQAALAKFSAEAKGGTPQDLADMIRDHDQKWRPIVKALNLKVE